MQLSFGKYNVMQIRKQIGQHYIHADGICDRLERDLFVSVDENINPVLDCCDEGKLHVKDP